jgi:hypothetical protein
MKINFLKQITGISNFKFQIPSVKILTKSNIWNLGILKFRILESWNSGILKFGIIGIFVILLSCNSKPTPSVSYFETQALTPEDRVKLANATGKTVRPIEIDALAAQINNATGKLHLFCFWNLESPNSISTLKAVHSLSTKCDSTKLRIVFVNMPGRQTMEAINLFIRENQLTDETLILEKADVSFFSKRIKKEFLGVTGLPVVILANKTDQTMQFYNRLMDEKELQAIVQPLL